MRIGIDAKWLFTGTISGRFFIENVLPELFSLHPEIEWHIFLDKKEKNLGWPFTRENVNIHYVWADFNMLSNLFVLPGWAIRLHVDAVLFQTFSPKSKHFKSVVFIHDILFTSYPEYFTWKERLYFKALKRTAPAADRIITTTQYVKDELVRLHYAKKDQPVDLAPSGVTDIFKPLRFHKQEILEKVKEKYNLPGSYLLFVGRLNARKNIENLIDSLRFVNDKNISLLIVGKKDWKSPQIEHLMNDKEIKSRIFFADAVSNDELSVIYAMATIFCFPSFAEGFGLPPLEAMASGVPAVVANTTAMPEVCGKAALYADPRDPGAIAQKINELLENKSLYDQKIQEGLEWSKNYTWRRTAEGIMNSIFAATGTKNQTQL
ncbi:MAG: glycosyltransferase family 1 protein [Bacteroidota bacterium]|nr:glycosyltransferase family 1 protein [Bacteroidota bacterium]